MSDKSNSERITLPINPRTARPCGYAFTTTTELGDAERAVSELSGSQILDRKVSVELSRRTDTASANSNIAKTERHEKRNDEGSIQLDQKPETSSRDASIAATEGQNTAKDEAPPKPELELGEILESAPSMNWNAVNHTKIRTSLGSGLDKDKGKLGQQILTGKDADSTRETGQSLTSQFSTEHYG